MLVSGPSVLISILSLVIASVTDAIDENVNRLLKLPAVVTVSYKDVAKVDVIKFEP